MTRCRSAGLLTLVGLMALAGLSCGGDDSGNPVSASSTNTGAPRVIAQGSLSFQAPTTESVFFAVVPVTDGSAGAWEATVDWTFATNTLWMYVANGSCTAAQFASNDCPNTSACACQFAVRSEEATPKPRVLSVANPAGTTRTLIVVNIGPREETASYVVRLTPTGTTSATDGGASGQASAISQTATGRKAIR
jgi:hypothetical protein